MAATTTARIGSAPLPDGREAEEFVLDDGRGMAARVGTHGARLLSLRVPDRAGSPVELVLGYDRLGDWAGDDGFMGATIGRCANRIARGSFELDGRTFHVPINNPLNALHGGPQGFDKAIWHAEPADGGAAALTLFHTSPDGDQGFPGALRASVRYTLTGDGALRLDYEAETDRPTVVNLTNHAYFNLAGGGTVLDHLLTIAADRFIPVDAALIPTGELRLVAGTPFDFREPARIGARVDEPGDEQLGFAGGYDHNFVLRPAPPGDDGRALRLAARLEEPSRGLSMEVWTTEPGLQFYSGNFLDGSRRGRRGAPLEHRGGLCLETQHFPDSPNRPEFPSVALRPGETFRSSTLYRFSATAAP